MKRTGWYNESARHSLAAKGVKSGRKSDSQKFLEVARRRAEAIEREPTGYEDYTLKELKEEHKSLTRLVEGDFDVSLDAFTDLQRVGEELSRREEKPLKAKGKKFHPPEGRLKAVMDFEEYVTELESAEVPVPKAVRKWVDERIEVEKVFDKAMREDLGD